MVRNRIGYPKRLDSIWVSNFNNGNRSAGHSHYGISTAGCPPHPSSSPHLRSCSRYRRIDEPSVGWKGRGLWVTSGNRAPVHIESIDAQGGINQNSTRNRYSNSTNETAPSNLHAPNPIGGCG
jgi:hypothetical protein